MTLALAERNKYGIDGTVKYEISRIEGLDWECDAYLRANDGYEDAARRFGEADDHVIEVAFRNTHGGRVWENELTIRELRELAAHLTVLAVRYAERTTRVKSDDLVDEDSLEVTHSVPEQHPGMVQE